MNTIAVVGCGLQGSCVAYGLMKLGYTVELVDLDNNILNTAAQKLRLLGCDVFAKHTCYKQLKNAKTLVSCAPYKINEAIHNWCGCNGVKYCDLGGNPEISEKINLNADKDKCQTFTDLGLAPGLANILAEKMFFNPVVYEGKKHKVDSVHICVGGLPVTPEGLGSLQYGRTFHIGGLTNEYSGYDTVIQDGKLVNVKTLAGIETFSMYKDCLEAFYTKGGLGLSVSRLQEKGMQNYTYKTIRYQGHVNLLKFLMEECCLEGDTLDKAMMNATPPITDDKVYIKLAFSSKSGVCGQSAYQIHHDKNWTAMQKSTAFPTAVIAGMMYDEKFKNKTYSLNYSHLAGELFKDFSEKLAFLGIQI